MDWEKSKHAKKMGWGPGTHNPSTQQAEAELQIQGQPGLQKETLCQQKRIGSLNTV
jgi:hypothetical protein